jgi:hypothetical protein
VKASVNACIDGDLESQGLCSRGHRVLQKTPGQEGNSGDKRRPEIFEGEFGVDLFPRLPLITAQLLN